MHFSTQAGGVVLDGAVRAAVGVRDVSGPLALGPVRGVRRAGTDSTESGGEEREQTCASEPPCSPAADLNRTPGAARINRSATGCGARAGSSGAEAILPLEVELAPRRALRRPAPGRSTEPQGSTISAWPCEARPRPVGAGLRGRHHVGEVLDRARAEQDLPVVLARALGERGGHVEDPGSPDRQRADRARGSAGRSRSRGRAAPIRSSATTTLARRARTERDSFRCSMPGRSMSKRCIFR